MRSTPAWDEPAHPVHNTTMPPEICPNCGAEVPPHVRCCPVCGADESTGWSEKADSQRLGLPDEEFDYDEFVKEEFEQPKKELRPAGIPWWAWLAAVLLLGALIKLWIWR